MKNLTSLALSLIGSYIFYIFTNEDVIFYITQQTGELGFQPSLKYATHAFSFILIIVTISILVTIKQLFDREYKYAKHFADSFHTPNSDMYRELGELVQPGFNKLQPENKIRNIEMSLSRIRTVLESNEKNIRLAVSVMKPDGVDGALRTFRGFEENGDLMKSDEEFSRGVGFCGWALSEQDIQCGPAKRYKLLSDKRFHKTSDDSEQKSYASLPIKVQTDNGVTVIGILNLISSNRSLFRNTENCKKSVYDNLLVMTRYIGYNL